VEELIILWLWLKALGFFLGIALIILVAVGELVWSLGNWIVDIYKDYMRKRVEGNL